VSDVEGDYNASEVRELQLENRQVADGDAEDRRFEAANERRLEKLYGSLAPYRDQGRCRSCGEFEMEACDCASFEAFE